MTKCLWSNVSQCERQKPACFQDTPSKDWQRHSDRGIHIYWLWQKANLGRCGSWDLTSARVCFRESRCCLGDQVVAKALRKRFCMCVCICVRESVSQPSPRENRDRNEKLCQTLHKRFSNTALSWDIPTFFSLFCVFPFLAVCLSPSLISKAQDKRLKDWPLTCLCSLNRTGNQRNCSEQQENTSIEQG